jgi:chromosomal replication initiation ATPase DnaA
VNAQDIIDATAAHFGMRPCDMIGPGRDKTRIKARFIACAMVRERLDMSYSEFAHLFGYNDHTSALNGVRRARHERQVNDFWADAYNAIERSLLDWREEEEIERLELGA